MGGSFGAADSFPKDFGYGEEEEEAELEGGPGPGGPGGGAGGPGGGAGRHGAAVRRSGRGGRGRGGLEAADPSDGAAAQREVLHPEGEGRLNPRHGRCRGASGSCVLRRGVRTAGRGAVRCGPAQLHRRAALRHPPPCSTATVPSFRQGLQSMQSVLASKLCLWIALSSLVSLSSYLGLMPPLCVQMRCL